MKKSHILKLLIRMLIGSVTGIAVAILFVTISYMEETDKQFFFLDHKESIITLLTLGFSLGAMVGFLWDLMTRGNNGDNVLSSGPSKSRKRGSWRLILCLVAAAFVVTFVYWLFSSSALRTFQGHKAAVSSIAFSPDGRFLVSGSYDTTVKVWDLSRDGAEATISQNPGSVSSIAFSPDGKTLVVATDENETVRWNEAGRMSSVGHTGKNGARAKLLDFPTGEVKATFAGHTLSVTFVAFVSDGKFIATCGNDNQVKLWDPQTGKEIRTLEGGIGIGGTLVAFSHDGKLMAVVDRHDAKILDVGSGKLQCILKGHSDQVSCLVFAPDSKLIATGGHDNTVRLWDVATGLAKATFPCHQKWAEAVQFSPDGKILAVGSREIAGEVPEFLQANGRVTLWDVASEKELVTNAAHSRGISSIAFSPRRDILATGGNDGAIKLWKVPARD